MRCTVRYQLRNLHHQLKAMQSTTNDDQTTTPSLGAAFFVWLKIGLLSFGGPAAQIGLMHKWVVAENKWLSEKSYLNALSFCMLLPGPEAMQLATYAGWRLHGTVGGIIAGLLFVIPGAVVIALLAFFYSAYSDVALVNQLFLGIKAAVIVVVLEALLRVAKKSLTSTTQWFIAAFAFVGIFFFNIPFPLIVLTAALFGYLSAPKNTDAHPNERTQPILNKNSTLFKSTSVTVLTWAALWAAPLLFLFLFTDQTLLVQLGVFFSKLAVVTFGGAYAVLAYLGQSVVADFGWLSAGEMMDGLGLAETTPGPLILVTEFVGFIAGYREGGLGLALAAAFLTLWVTFTPCFLWIFTGAPFLDWICEQPKLKGALNAITAAVVGVILNLSVWFALHVLFDEVNRESFGALQLWLPDLSSLNIVVVVLTALCMLAAFRLHWNIVTILFTSALLGLGLSHLLS